VPAFFTCNPKGYGHLELLISNFHVHINASQTKKTGSGRSGFNPWY
jgi:hypothetical protein